MIDNYDLIVDALSNPRPKGEIEWILEKDCFVEDVLTRNFGPDYYDELAWNIANDKVFKVPESVEKIMILETSMAKVKYFVYFLLNGRKIISRINILYSLHQNSLFVCDYEVKEVGVSFK